MSIVALFGSPTENSRSSSLLRHALARIGEATPRSEVVLRDLPPAALVRADFNDPAIRRAREQVASAKLVLIATPIYKAAYSGLLKTFLDLLPQDGLRGKTVMVIGTGGSAAHLLALEYSLRPVLAALGARHILDTVYAVDSKVTPEGSEGHSIHEDIQERVDRALADGPHAMRLVRAPAVALAA